jgi:hypothetical protein
MPVVIIISSGTILLAKKRRRRRSDPDISSGSSSDATSLPRSSPTTGRGSDDLPDFDLDEDDPDAKAVKSSSMSSSSSTASSSAPLLGEGEISSAMMGSSDAPTKSIRELLSDRSLESKLKFDVTNDGDAEPLPDLVELQRQKKQKQSSSSLQSTANAMSVGDTTSGEGMGSRKKSRQAQRQAAAAARQQQEEEDSFGNPLAKIPFLLNEKGEVAGTKILEAGAWLGIFLLVAWELYINSPFFDRAAPITPVVY